MNQKKLDIVCLGRAAVDLYGQQVGGRLEDMQSFSKYLGGSSANLAAGLGRLGVKSAMLTRVGNDHMGRFVREQLAKEGVDVSHVSTDPTRLTGLVILGISANGDIPHIFFRERCADMGLVVDDIDERFIASARAFAVTGTHLSTPTTQQAVVTAMKAAKANGTHVILDIDYRPVLWGLTVGGDGASRYIESQEVSIKLQGVLEYCNLIVGTEEEIAIAGGSSNLLCALQSIRKVSDAAIVLKRGAKGCTVFDTKSIEKMDDGIVIPGFPVEVFNTVGAGDAFLSGFLRAWLDGKSWQECGLLGNACGAIVVTRHGCTPAMPSHEELAYFMTRNPLPDPRRDKLMKHLHRVSLWSRDPRPLCVLAYDHRSQFEDLAEVHGRPKSDIGRFKMLLTDVLREVAGDGSGPVHFGAIIDERYGNASLEAISENNYWTALPIELPGSRPIDFDPQFGAGQWLLEKPSGLIVKCLVFFHPDDSVEIRCAQEDKLQELYTTLVSLERRIVLEIICPDIGAAALPDPLIRTLQRLYELDIKPDWWKLAPQTPENWEKIADIIKEQDPYCEGVVVLGLGADEAPLLAGLSVAARFEICRGFAVGRSIFAEAAENWFAGRINDDDAKAIIAKRYNRLIDTWLSNQNI